MHIITRERQRQRDSESEREIEGGGARVPHSRGMTHSMVLVLGQCIAGQFNFLILQTYIQIKIRRIIASFTRWTSRSLSAL